MIRRNVHRGLAPTFLVAFGLLLIGRSPAVEPTIGLPLAKPAEVGMEDGPLSAIAARMGQFVEQQQVSGAVTLVARQGKIVHLEAVGQADLENKLPMQKDSLFAVASMTKPITAAAIMILKDEGKLGLDDPVAKHLPSFKDVVIAEKGAKPRQPKTQITIRHLLTHTAGLGGNQQNEGTIKETVEKLAKRPLSFEPGTKWQYSPALTVCGGIVEVVSGQAFDEFLRKRIFEPLKMVDTSFHPTPEQQKRLVKLYQQDKDKKSLSAARHWINDLSEGRTPNPSGGLFSTAADMARFYQMMLSGGELDGKRILSAESVKEMTRVQSGELLTGFTGGNAWGLGFCLVQKPQGVTAMLSSGAFGHGGAFGTQSWADPKRQMVFILLIQRMGLPNSDASSMREALQDLAVKAVRE
jgi:CubicO group peptidase (beta-lactamase class C family)